MRFVYMLACVFLSVLLFSIAQNVHQTDFHYIYLHRIARTICWFVLSPATVRAKKLIKFVVNPSSSVPEAEKSNQNFSTSFLPFFISICLCFFVLFHLFSKSVFITVFTFKYSIISVTLCSFWFFFSFFVLWAKALK